MSFKRAERRREERAAKARKPLPAFIDLIQWIKMRERVSTGKAKAIILAGALKHDSHTIGITTVKLMDREHKLLNQLVPAEWRGEIDVVIPEALQ